MRATFPWAARLHRPSEYALALRGKRVAQGALFVVLTPRQTENTASMARLGLIVPKRLASRATTRNTIKRIIREVFRQRRHKLPNRDYVFRLKSAIPPLSLTALKTIVRDEAETLLDRAIQ